MKRILCLLMPYSGHFFPHINLLRLLASKGAFVRVYCDRKFQPHVPQEFISLENYPQEIVSYCQYIANYQKDRERAAKEYFSYMADGKIIALRRQREEEMACCLAERLGDAVRRFSPEIVLYDAQAPFTIRLRQEIPCPQFELNASTFLPKLWQSPSFQRYYQEILRPSYPGAIDYDQILALQRKNGRKENRKQAISFGYLSPMLQDEFEKIPDTCKSIGFQMTAPRSEKRDGIYITRGTVSESHGAFLLYDTVNALSGCPEPIHVSCGANFYVKQLFEKQSFAQHVHIHSYTDQKQMLANSRVFVTHGGITGVREAIFAHIPMLVIPANFPDYQVGQAIEKNHAGILIRKRPLHKEEIRESYEKICRHYDDYLDGVAHMAKELNAYWSQYGAEAVWKECEQAL